MNKELKRWCKSKKLQISELAENIYKIEEVGTFLHVQPKEIQVESEEGEVEDIEALIDRSNYTLILSAGEKELFVEHECSYYLIEFGNSWYYSKSAEDLVLNPFIYLGKAQKDIDLDFCNLGVHGGYEILNGSRVYSDWCKKTKFLGYKTLGICEKNTLAGVLEFQSKCKDSEIKPIIGETVTVKAKGITFDLKLYCTDELGWKNLLRVNNEIKVTNEQPFVTEEFLLSHTEGLVCVLPTTLTLSLELIRKYKKAFPTVYYQIDTVEYTSDEKDREVLLNMKLYFEKYFLKIRPILINDSYYLEKEDYKIKKLMNNFRSSGHFEFASENQYYKDVTDSFKLFSALFTEETKIEGIDFFDLFDFIVTNTMEVVDSCNFEIVTEGFKIPKFYATNLGDKYDGFNGNNEGLFDFLIEENMLRFGFNDDQRYLDRVKEEVRVIKKGGFIDYFLILWDVINYCNSNNILTGLGRGSAAGCLIAYLFDITRLDPIQYDLLFERFLNEGRIGSDEEFEAVEIMFKDDTLKKYLTKEKVRTIRNGEKTEVLSSELVETDLIYNKEIKSISPAKIVKRIGGTLPDIDTDIESGRREEVRKYIEFRYGRENVTNVGSYNTYKIKSAFQDLCKQFNIPASKADELSKVIDDDFNGRWTTSDFNFYFRTACSNKDFYDFIQTNPDVIINSLLILKQPSSASIHPCAIIITPREDKDGNPMSIYEWMPVRRDKETGQLISEWTGDVLSEAGFLKEDLLGLKQLDKFRQIFDLVETHTGKKLTYNDLTVDQPEVMEYFKQGISQDIFQFGSPNLIGYTKRVQPDTVEELITINAIYRPGPIDSGAHEDYIKIKNGELEPQYDRCLEKVTKNTFGLYIYQEQVMAAASILGDFTMTEADDVRRAMGKMKASAMEPYRVRFFAGAIEKGYTEQEVSDLWNKLLRFSSYGYNRSHAAAYAVTAYFCQYLKTFYPLEFFTTSLLNSKDDQVPARLSEIKQLGGISISAPDINYSNMIFTPNAKKQSIFWSLPKIKFVGESAANVIIEERTKNGKFFSLEEFLQRVNLSIVNIRVCTNLILAGAMDEVMQINKVQERLKAIKELFKLTKKEKDFKEENYPKELVLKEYFWTIKQKELTGLGEIDFKRIIDSTPLKTYTAVKETSFFTKEFSEKKTYVVAGIVSEIKELKSKKDATYIFGQVTLNINNVEINITLWKDDWSTYGQKLKEFKGGIIVFSGAIKKDTFRGGCNCFYPNYNTEIKFL